jgi:DNA-binding NtrC family response regulator
MVDGAHHTPQAEHTMAGHLPQERLRILMVEDNHSYARMLTTMLEGHERIAAHSWVDARRLFMQHKPDMVFLDIQLPDGSGIDLLVQMRQLLPEAAVYMITSSQQASDVENARAIGAAGYVLKPFNRARVLACVDDCLQQRQRRASMGDAEYQRWCDDAKARAKTWLEQHPPQTVVANHNVQASPVQPGLSVRRQRLQQWHLAYVGGTRANHQRFAQLCTEVGCQSSGFLAGKAFLRALSQKRSFRFLIVEDDIPDMDPAMLVLQWRNHAPDLPVVLIVDDAWQRDNPKWSMLNVQAFLSKPVSTGSLLAVLEHSLDQELANLPSMQGVSS